MCLGHPSGDVTASYRLSHLDRSGEISPAREVAKPHSRSCPRSAALCDPTDLSEPTPAIRTTNATCVWSRCLCLTTRRDPSAALHLRLVGVVLDGQPVHRLGLPVGTLLQLLVPRRTLHRPRPLEHASVSGSSLIRCSSVPLKLTIHWLPLPPATPVWPAQATPPATPLLWLPCSSTVSQTRRSRALYVSPSQPKSA